MATRPKMVRKEAAMERQQAYEALTDKQKVERAGKKHLNKMAKKNSSLGLLAKEKLGEANV